MITANEVAEIKSAVANIGVSQTVTITCPCCESDYVEQNRPSNWRPERSMSVTKDRLGILYHCHRATCPRGNGFIPSLSINEPVKRKEFTPHEYKDSLRSLSEGERHSLEESYEITEADIHAQGILYNSDRSSYIFPIRDIRGYDVGLVDRDFSGTRDLKAISYWFNDVPKLHFILGPNGKGDKCIVVEDIPSAIKASKYMTAVALLGSHINDLQAAHLARLFTTVILALDNDAFLKAIKLRNKYTFYFKEFMLLRLQEDIKNMKYTELDEMLGCYDV